MRTWTSLVGLICVFAMLSTGATAETVRIKGSNTFGEELGPRLIKAYQGQHPGIDIELESKGSGTGITALLAGECDIAPMSRSVNEDELRLARSREIRLKYCTVGYYGVAVIVNEINPIEGLSDSQIADIFTGRIDNWKVLGWEDQPISTFIRDPVSGTYLGFQELAMRNEPYVDGATRLPSYSAIAEAVSRHPYAIGYSGAQRFDALKVKSVKVNGVPLNSVAVNEGLYPYARLLRFVTSEKHETPEATDFIHFVQSKDGRAILTEMGYVPKLKPVFGKFSTMGY